MRSGARLLIALGDCRRVADLMAGAEAIGAAVAFNGHRRATGRMSSPVSSQSCAG